MKAFLEGAPNGVDVGVLKDATVAEVEFNVPLILGANGFTTGIEGVPKALVVGGCNELIDGWAAVEIVLKPFEVFEELGGWDGAPNGFAIELGAPNVLAGIFGAKGLNGESVADPNVEGVDADSGAKGFVVAGTDELLEASVF